MSTCFLTTLQPNVCVLGDCMAASYKSDVHTKSHTMDWFVGMGGGIYLERMGRRGVLDLFFCFFPIEIKSWESWFNNSDDLLASGVEKIHGGTVMGAPFLSTFLQAWTYRDSRGPKRAKRAFWGEMGNLEATLLR